VSDLQLVIAAGLFSLGGVVIGALLTPSTQLYLERTREKRTADRAKLLVAGELLHAQLVLRAASEGEHWPYTEDANAAAARLPSSVWEENRSSLVGHVDEDLMNQLIMVYATLEIDRTRFVTASRLPAETSLPPREAQSLKQFSNELGRLRRQLGGGGGWLDEIHDEFKPRMASLNDDFKRWLDGLSDEEIKRDNVIAKVKDMAHDLGELNRHLGDDGAWSAEISVVIDRRLK
jgi:hypothetical protein